MPNLGGFVAGGAGGSKTPSRGVSPSGGSSSEGAGGSYDPSKKPKKSAMKKPKQPDVTALQSQIAALQAQVASLQPAASSSASSVPSSASSVASKKKSRAPSAGSATSATSPLAPSAGSATSPLAPSAGSATSPLAPTKPKNFLQAVYGNATKLPNMSVEELKRLLTPHLGQITVEMLCKEPDGRVNVQVKHFLLAIVYYLRAQSRKDKHIAAVLGVFTLDVSFKEQLCAATQFSEAVCKDITALYGGEGLLANCQQQLENAGVAKEKLKQAAVKGVSSADGLFTAYKRACGVH